MAAPATKLYTLQKLISGNQILDRIQDQWMSVLNPTLALGTSRIQGYTVPIPTASNNGQFIEWDQVSGSFIYATPYAPVPTGITPGTYGDSTHVGQFAVNTFGYLTSAANIAISGSSTLPAGSTVGQYLEWNGTAWVVNTIPLPVAQGGTGDTTLLQNALLVGDGTSAVTTSAAPTSAIIGGVAEWNGSSWVVTQGPGQNIDTIPLSPSSIDDEFESTSLNGSWFIPGAGSITAATTVADGTVVWTYCAPWVPGNYFATNTYCIAPSGYIYKATSGNAYSYQGPSGTSSSITTDGTVTWKYLGGTSGSGGGQTNFYWQASESYASTACLMLPQTGVMWINLAGSSFTSGTTMPAGLVASSPSATVTDGAGAWTQVPLWQPNTAYSSSTPSYVACNGAVYQCTTGGTSYNGPTVSSSTQTEGSITWTYEATPSGSWAASTSYVSTSTISALSPSTNFTYICTTAGTSGPIQPLNMTSAYGQAGTVAFNAGVTNNNGLAVGALPWQPSYTYLLGQRVVNTATPYSTTLNAYQCITPGASASSGGPTTTSSNITDNAAHWCYMGNANARGIENVGSTDPPPVWAISTAYNLGSTVFNKGGMYICVGAGTSAGSGGPSGTSMGQTDHTVTWNYMSQGQAYLLYDLTNRPGGIALQGNGTIVKKATLPNTFIYWGKVEQSYVPSTTSGPTQRGCFMTLYAGLQSGADQLRIGYIQNSSSGTYAGAGWSLNVVATIKGSSAINSEWTYNGVLTTQHDTINYLALMVSGNNGASNQVISFWAAGADGAWFPIPVVTSGGTVANLINTVAGGTNNWNYAGALNVNYSVYPGDPITQIDYVRGRFNTLVLP